MRIIATLMLALGLTGCLVLPFDTWTEAPSAPKPGDLVRVETREGVKHVFRVYKTEEGAFYGVAKDNLRYKVPYAALRTLEVRGQEYDLVAIPAGATGVANTAIILMGD